MPTAKTALVAALAVAPAVVLVVVWRQRNRRQGWRGKGARTPKRLILVRHGESEGNVDHTIYASVADNALHLTEKGWMQALSAGRALKEIVGEEQTCFYVSPYVRTRETFHAIASAWGGLEHVRWHEDPRIREQDFGNFQDLEATARQKEERKQFGSFYYRFPQGGESGADVYDRVSSFMESLYRHWSEHPQIDNYVLVIHGVSIAAFLMRFFKYSVDEFHQYENSTNCEMAVMERDSHARLSLQYVVRNEEGFPERREQREVRPPHHQLCRDMRFR